jgi:hypothetical protein
MAKETSALPLAFHSHQFLLAQPGGALLPRSHRQVRAASGANTTVLSDQRINSDENYIEADGNYAYDYFAYDYTFGDEFVLGADGSATETLDQFFVGAGGTARLLTGQSTAYSIELDVQAQSVPQAGPVFLNPLGVVNTANYLPITNPVAGGEFLSFYGAGLSSVYCGGFAAVSGQPQRRQRIHK